ncbi:dipeptidase PepE [Microbacterium sp. AK031]|uniref:dipeptidase PepE n=1 Tax=Microbacterium sp. AK031 TaxID=2723076 RepID=UPI002168417C|nr:dipeptidase PepE [Microbacterium sp. AK031]MCS3841913.1 dipeptidase E [Microbacterium sp. AK031]
MIRALLMSSSRKDNLGYLEHAGEQLALVLGEQDDRPKPIRAVLIPYAAVSTTFETYEELAKPAFAAHGVELTSIHRMADPVQAIREAEVIAVAGGNTFALLNRLYAADLVDAIRERVTSGAASYVGWSAGTNVATPSIRTTNDMPIVEPPSFAALRLVPFQMNPHFIPGKPVGHNGESREERLREFIDLNPSEEVLALYEGCALWVTGDHARIVGEREGLVFSQEGEVRSIAPGESFPLSSIREAAL